MESSAHNPKVTGSSPVPATKGDPSLKPMGFLFGLFLLLSVNELVNTNKSFTFLVRNILFLINNTPIHNQFEGINNN